MYVIEHALLNLGKNKGRNLLLGVIIFAVITAAAAALAIFNTSGFIIKETKTALQCAVRVFPKIRQMSANGNPAPMVSLELYLSFADSEYLDGADIKEDSRGTDGVDAVYYLKHPDMLAAYESELRTKGLPDGYTVRSDESAFESVAGHVESLHKLSLTFLVIVLVLGSVIMVLLSVIAIRERKYEIGVLRAMGMKKKKVVLSLWTEIIAITCIYSAFGIGMGTLLSQPVSDSILAGLAKGPALQTSTLQDRLNDQNGVDTGKAETVKISLDGVTVLEILGISLLLASIAGVVSVSRITKSEPIKILMERN